MNLFDLNRWRRAVAAFTGDPPSECLRDRIRNRTCELEERILNDRMGKIRLEHDLLCSEAQRRMLMEWLGSEQSGVHVVRAAVK